MLTVNLGQTTSEMYTLFGRKRINNIKDPQKMYLVQSEIEVDIHYKYLAVILDSIITNCICEMFSLSLYYITEFLAEESTVYFMNKTTVTG